MSHHQITQGNIVTTFARYVSVNILGMIGLSSTFWQIPSLWPTGWEAPAW